MKGDQLHHPAEPDRERLAAMLARAGRRIAGDDHDDEREWVSGHDVSDLVAEADADIAAGRTYGEADMRAEFDVPGHAQPCPEDDETS